MLEMGTAGTTLAQPATGSGLLAPWLTMLTTARTTMAGVYRIGTRSLCAQDRAAGCGGRVANRGISG